MKASLSTWTTRIYFDDTDAAAVVYHANYLKIFERARNDQFLEAGFDHLAHYKEHKECFVVAHVDIDYKMSAVLGDVVTVESTLQNHSPVRITIGQNMVKNGKTIAIMTVVLVWVDRDGKPKRMPHFITAFLQQLSKVNNGNHTA